MRYYWLTRQSSASPSSPPCWDFFSFCPQCTYFILNWVEYLKKKKGQGLVLLVSPIGVGNWKDAFTTADNIGLTFPGGWMGWMSARNALAIFLCGKECGFQGVSSTSLFSLYSVTLSSILCLFKCPFHLCFFILYHTWFHCLPPSFHPSRVEWSNRNSPVLVNSSHLFCAAHH